ncbi:MAG: flagellar hook-length control protein FliK [Lachnotalea sp.]
MEIGNSNITSNNQNVLGSGQSEQFTQTGKVQSQTNDISSLSTGTIFQGEIKDVKGSQVSIGLDNGQVLNAKMESNVNLSVGQKIMFEVKSNTGSQIEIKPALESVNLNPVLEKALQAANISITNRNMEMVSSMIKEGMSIDKQSLSNMLRQFNINSDTDSATIVKMNKLGIDATTENVKQFENYNNYEHRIVKGIDNIAENLVKLLGETASEDNHASIALNQKLVEILNNNYSTENKGISAKQDINIMLNSNASEQEETINNENSVVAGKTKEPVQTQMDAFGNPMKQQLSSTNLNQELKQVTVTSAADLENIEYLNSENKSANKLGINSTSDNLNIVDSNKQNISGANTELDINEDTKNINSVNTTNIEKNINYLKNSNIMDQDITENVGLNKDNNAQTMKSGQILENILSSDERSNLSDKLKSLGADTTQLEIVKEGKSEAKDVLNLVKNLLLDPNNVSKADSLFSSKEYLEVLKQVIKQQWLVEPDNLKEPDKMGKLYKQMDAQTRQITAMLETVGKEDSNAFKEVTNLRNNINFMEQINQNFTYLQIPVQFSNEETHSDLYVYTNKKNLKKHDGNLSVLLHLDMEVLGTTDIYIKMSENSVSANFSLEDNNSIELVENNLENLIMRLKEKGYNASAQVGPLEKEQDFVEDFLEKDTVVTSLKRYAFDVRT